MTRLARALAPLAAAAALALVPAVAAAQDKPAAPAATATPLPSAIGYEPKDELERGLWHEMAEQERLVKESKLLVTDPELNQYVRGVLCRTVGADRCQAARIYIVRTPYFNASMAPNGLMLVNTGLLLRMRNEAQLAAVLGHEFAHFERQHSLRLFREIRSKTDAMSWLSLIPIPYVGMLGQIALIGSVYGFNRDMEREADSGSVIHLEEAGYDPRAASVIWAQLGQEMDATAKDRGSKSRKDKNGGFFGTHPKTTERMSKLGEQASALVRADKLYTTEEAKYRAVLAKWWPELIADQIKLSDFGGTEFLLAALAGNQSEGWTPDLLYARGELYRARGQAGDFAAAAGFYQAALDGGAQLPEAWRGLGLARLRLGETDAGKAALREYLARAPMAHDAAMIAAMAT